MPKYDVKVTRVETSKAVIRMTADTADDAIESSKLVAKDTDLYDGAEVETHAQIVRDLSFKPEIIKRKAEYEDRDVVFTTIDYDLARKMVDTREMYELYDDDTEGLVESREELEERINRGAVIGIELGIAKR